MGDDTSWVMKNPPRFKLWEAVVNPQGRHGRVATYRPRRGSRPGDRLAYWEYLVNFPVGLPMSQWVAEHELELFTQKEMTL